MVNHHHHDHGLQLLRVSYF